MANNFEINLVADTSDFVLDGTNPPATGTVQDRPYLAFDDTTNEIVRTKGFYVPTGFTNSGTLYVDIGYSINPPGTAAPSGDVVWEVSIEAVTEADTLDLFAAESFDTANSLTDTVDTVTGRLAVANVDCSTNKDNMGPDDYIRLKIERNAASGSDTAAGDARIFIVRFREQQ